MNDWRLVLNALNEMVAASREDMKIVERAGLYGGATALLDRLERWVREAAADIGSEPDGYALEKIGQARQSFGALLGFDITSGKPHSQHKVWGYTALDSLGQTLRQRQDIYGPESDGKE